MLKLCSINSNNHIYFYQNKILKQDDESNITLRSNVTNQSSSATSRALLFQNTVCLLDRNEYNFCPLLENII